MASPPPTKNIKRAKEKDLIKNQKADRSGESATKRLADKQTDRKGKSLTRRLDRVRAALSGDLKKIGLRKNARRHSW